MVQLAILFFTALYPAIMIRRVQDQPFWASYPHKLGRQNLKQILKWHAKILKLVKVTGQEMNRCLFWVF